jgi:23S rRNA (cytidine1920-2'-O)/16S rRNA (cytidine1409-2'-O)-methyltransferase
VAVVDTSFISLRQVLPAVARLLLSGGDAVVLIKPQFEAGRDQVGKKGVVRSPAVWADVLYGVLEWAMANGWSVLGLERSPIHGPAGNVEFLAHLRRGDEPGVDISAAIARVLDGD